MGARGGSIGRWSFVFLWGGRVGDVARERLFVGGIVVVRWLEGMLGLRQLG